jgi:hypothetical protein
VNNPILIVRYERVVDQPWLCLTTSTERVPGRMGDVQTVSIDPFARNKRWARSAGVLSERR